MVDESQLYFQCMCLAEKRLWVTSPYFVPDAVIEEALVTAALRGVDVRLLVPDKSDVPIVTVAARSYYPCLLEAGVRVFDEFRNVTYVTGKPDPGKNLDDLAATARGMIRLVDPHQQVRRPWGWWIAGGGVAALLGMLLFFFHSRFRKPRSLP